MTSGSAPLGAPPGSASWKRRRRRERRRRRRHLGAPTSRRPVKEATARRCVGFSLAFHSPCRRDVGVPRRVPTRRRRSQEGADGDVGIPQDADETSALPGGFGVRRAGVHVIRLPYSDGHGSPTPFNCASRADRLAMVGEAD